MGGGRGGGTTLRVMHGHSPCENGGGGAHDLLLHTAAKVPKLQYTRRGRHTYIMLYFTMSALCMHVPVCISFRTRGRTQNTTETN